MWGFVRGPMNWLFRPLRARAGGFWVSEFMTYLACYRQADTRVFAVAYLHLPIVTERSILTTQKA